MPATRVPASRRRAIQRRLVAWYRREHRDLPWRRTRDPYLIWLSEAMLQQTRVETVIPYYERFVERFPDVETLACADEQDVLRAWAGLGYYSRARNLKRAAERIVDEHGASVPRDADALRALPGIGAYTTGAIRSIAFRERAASVDGNVTRVLARLQGLRAPAAADIWALAEQLVPAERPDLFNQGLMELGATVCTPRGPRCSACPLTTLCAARQTGRPEIYPAPRSRPAPRRVRATAGVLRLAERVLLVRRPSHGLLGGLWELPNVEGPPRDAARALVERVRDSTGIPTRPGSALGSIRHGFTHRDLTLDLLQMLPTEQPLPALDPDRARFQQPDAADELPLSTLTRKCLALATAPARKHRAGGVRR